MKQTHLLSARYAVHLPGVQELVLGDGAPLKLVVLPLKAVMFRENLESAEDPKERVIAGFFFE